MILAIIEATRSHPTLREWSAPYKKNVITAYIEAHEILLIPESGVLAGIGSRATVMTINDRSAFLDVLKSILGLWGSFQTSSDFVNNFLIRDIGIEKVIEFDLIPQFRRQQSFSTAFANEMRVNLQEGDAGLDEAERTLAQFFQGINDNGSQGELIRISNFSSWIDLMSVTGILHGSTLSLNRMDLTQQFLSIADPENHADTYGSKEKTAANIGATVIQGAQKDRYVYSPSYYAHSRRIPDSVKRTIAKYNAMSVAVKAEFLCTLLKPENIDIFRDYGWILTDHAPENVDGKQLTVATYF